MTIHLGADSLCWHLRLEQGGIPLQTMLEEAAAAGASSLQINLHHVRSLRSDELTSLADDARSLGLRLLAGGDFLGAARHGDSTEVGVGRIATWLDRAAAMRSPILRVVSGFYRADLAHRPDLIELELRYISDVLRAAAPEAKAAGIKLLLENHSDFTSEEYRRIVEGADPEAVGVFLDLINAVSALEDPVAVVDALAPYAHAGHAKDYVFESIPTDDGYHRRGFSVLWRYPGEGVAPHEALIQALTRGVGQREFHLTVEGLDNRGDVADQPRRLRESIALLRGLISDQAPGIGSARGRRVG